MFVGPLRCFKIVPTTPSSNHPHEEVLTLPCSAMQTEGSYNEEVAVLRETLLDGRCEFELNLP